MKVGIFCRSAQFVLFELADFRVAFLEPFLVRDSSLLYDLDIHWTATAFVPVEQRLFGLLCYNLVQRIDKLHRIVYAAIQAETADWVIDMCRVPGKKNASGAELSRNALVGLIEVGVDDLIRFR